MFLWNHHILPPFLSKSAGRWSTILSGCLLFLVDAREGSEVSVCWCSADNVGAEASSWSEVPTSVFWSCCSDWDIVSSTAGSVFTLSSFSLAIWLPLIRIVSAEFSVCMKDVLKPFLMMNVAGTVFVFSLALNRMGSHRSNSATAGSLTLGPNKNSTGFLPLVFEVLRCVISALCRNAPNDTSSSGLHAWSARFTVWNALSASPLAFGW